MGRESIDFEDYSDRLGFIGEYMGFYGMTRQDVIG